MKMSKNIGVFVDYFRIPKSNPGYIDEWVCVRSNKEFIEWMTNHYREWKTMPKLFSIDHDLSPEHIEFYYLNPKGTLPDYNSFEEKTGLHVSKFIMEMCVLNNIPMDFKVCSHSENQLGRENIIKMVNHYKEEKDCFYMDWKEYDYVPERKEIYDSIKAREYNEFEEELRIDNIRKRLEKELYGNNN